MNATSAGFYGKHQIITQLRINNFDLHDGIEIDTYLDSMHFPPDCIGREILLVVKSHGIDNRGTFQTDSNGLLMMNRSIKAQSNSHEDYSGNEVEENFYPITTAIQIADREKNNSFWYNLL